MTTREAWPQAQAQMSESVGGGRHAEQATHAIRHCNQNTLADKLKGDTRGEEVGGWTRVTKRRAFLRRTCQSRGAQVVGGGWTNRNGRGGIGRLHVDLRRRNLGTTASFRNWLDLVSSHAMIKVLGGLSSSNEQGGHTYFFFFFLPWPVAGLCFAGNSAWRREERERLARPTTAPWPRQSLADLPPPCTFT